MKQTIQWHEQCLLDFNVSLAKKRENLASLQAEVAHMEAQAAFYDQQIQRAKDLGKDGFDRDKFGVPHDAKNDL